MLLAINTAFILADIALKKDNIKIVKKFNSSEKHSETLLKNIDEILFLNNFNIKDLKTMAVVIGPGSFTGIRIGVAVAKGFKAANPKLKLIEINSFELMSTEFLKQNPNFKGEYTCVIDALSGKYYACRFNSDNCGEPILIEDEKQLLNENLIVGLSEEKLSFADKFVTLTPDGLLYMALFKESQAFFCENLTPLYLRKSQAEDNLKD